MTETTRLTILKDGEEQQMPATFEDERVWLRPEDFTRLTGWHLEDRGLCRESRCIPLLDRGSVTDGGRIDVAAFATKMEMPWVIDRAEGAAALGESAGARTEALASLEAPDFSLPDLDGKPTKLSDFRGRKVLLLAFSSW
jgi:hypothetical protein